MRITNVMMTANYLQDLNRNRIRLDQYQTQLATNRRITRLSDDPVGIIGSLNVRTQLNNLEQYQSNIDAASAWLTQSETAVMDLNEVVKSAYELALEASSGTQGPTEKAAIAQAISQLREHVLQVGNASLGDKYIFGGYNTTTAPFNDTGGTVLYQETDLLTAGPAQIEKLNRQAIAYEIGSGLRMDVSLTGADLMGAGTDNLIGILDQLRQVLASNGSTGDIMACADKLQQKQDDILCLAADIGGRINRLDLVSSRYSQDEINYETIRSSVEDIDTAEAIMKLKLTETVYNSALSIGSKIIQSTLLDFLN